MCVPFCVSVFVALNELVVVLGEFCCFYSGASSCFSSSVHIFDAWLHLQHQGADAVQQLQEQVTG